MNCYGNYSRKKKDCKTCKLASYCCDAGDPGEDLQGKTVSYDVIEDHENFAVSAIPVAVAEKAEPRRYTRKDMLEAIAFMVCLDAQTLEFLDLKINDPSLSFSDIARGRNISRQAVHKFILKRCREIPELEPLLHNRQNRMKQGGTNNFMEAVCQIRQQTSRKKSAKPNVNSNSSGILTSLTRSLDLSRMSICKGARNSAAV